MTRSLVVMVAAILLAAAPVSAHTTSRSGDVVTRVAMGSRALDLPLIPGWHYHRQALGSVKNVLIGPYKAGGITGPPMVWISVVNERIHEPASFVQDAAEMNAARKIQRGRMLRSGTRRIGDLTVPYYEMADPQGRRGYHVLFDAPGLQATIGFIGYTRGPGEPAFDTFEAFLRGVRIR